MSGVCHVEEVAVQKLAGEHIIAERNGASISIRTGIATQQHSPRQIPGIDTRGRYILYRECQCGGEDGNLYIRRVIPNLR